MGSRAPRITASRAAARTHPVHPGLRPDQRATHGTGQFRLPRPVAPVAARDRSRHRRRAETHSRGLRAVLPAAPRPAQRGPSRHGLRGLHRCRVSPSPPTTRCATGLASPISPAGPAQSPTPQTSRCSEPWPGSASPSAPSTSAPSRIRTCAHGSGVRCSARPLPAGTAFERALGADMGRGPGLARPDRIMASGSGVGLGGPATIGFSCATSD
jgi:hypothetical protein